MVQGWVTILVLAFGIIVAIIGVIAYLRMFRKDRLSASSQSTADVTPPHQDFAASKRDGELDKDTGSEEVIPKD